jgi:DNA-binding transcriptional LysR family regulator
MDRFDTITAFVAVADHQGFAPAARHLGISASAITRSVAALEERLGIRLLQRTTRSVTLTDAGARYLQRARQILMDLDEADGSAQAERATPAGRFVVSASAVFGRLHVGPLMCQYLRRYPAVTGELLLSDRWVNLVEDGVDLAVRIGQLTDSSLVTRRLGETRRVVVGAPAYLARRGAPQQPSDLDTHAIIHFSVVSGGSDEWRFFRHGQPESVAVKPHYVTNSADAAIWHAEHEGGLTMVLAYQVADLVKAGRLQIVLADFEPPVMPIQLAYPTARLLSAKVRAFIDMAVELCDWRFADL